MEVQGADLSQPKEVELVAPSVGEGRTACSLNLPENCTPSAADDSARNVAKMIGEHTSIVRFNVNTWHTSGV